MILTWMVILATPACIATGPHEFACTSMEACMGVFGDKVYRDGFCEVRALSLNELRSILHRRPAPMGYGVKMNAPECSSSAHPHLRSMDTSRPDVKGAGLPLPDGKCHLDKTDAVTGGV